MLAGYTSGAHFAHVNVLGSETHMTDWAGNDGQAILYYLRLKNPVKVDPLSRIHYTLTAQRPAPGVNRQDAETRKLENRRNEPGNLFRINKSVFEAMVPLYLFENRPLNQKP